MEIMPYYFFVIYIYVYEKIYSYSYMRSSIPSHRVHSLYVEVMLQQTSHWTVTQNSSQQTRRDGGGGDKTKTNATTVASILHWKRVFFVVLLELLYVGMMMKHRLDSMKTFIMVNESIFKEIQRKEKKRERERERERERGGKKKKKTR